MACTSLPVPKMCGKDDANEGVACIQGKKMRPTLVEFSKPLPGVSRCWSPGQASTYKMALSWLNVRRWMAHPVSSKNTPSQAVKLRYLGELGHVLDEAGSPLREEAEVREDERLVGIKPTGNLRLLASPYLAVGEQADNVFGTAEFTISGAGPTTSRGESAYFVWAYPITSSMVRFSEK